MTLSKNNFHIRSTGASWPVDYNFLFFFTKIGFTHCRNQRMADDQSVVGRRRIYYDPYGNEALICSESDEEIADSEEEKHEFSEGEDQILW